MNSGTIKLLTTSVPSDAPQPLPGETAWFEGTKEPIQIGVYRRLSISGATTYSYWDGALWLWNRASPDLAVRVSSLEPSLIQTLPWCGLVMPARSGYGPMPTRAMHRGDLGGAE